jgi:hypothetical protein
MDTWLEKRLGWEHTLIGELTMETSLSECTTVDVRAFTEVMSGTIPPFSTGAVLPLDKCRIVMSITDPTADPARRSADMSVARATVLIEMLQEALRKIEERE